MKTIDDPKPKPPIGLPVGSIAMVVTPAPRATGELDYPMLGFYNANYVMVESKPLRRRDVDGPKNIWRQQVVLIRDGGKDLYNIGAALVDDLQLIFIPEHT